MNTRKNKISSPNRIETILYLIADLLNDHVIWKAIVQIIPAVILFLLTEVLSSFFYNSENKLIWYRVILGVIIFLFPYIFIILADFKQSVDNDIRKTQEMEMVSYVSEIQLRKAIAEADISLEEQRNRNIRLQTDRLGPSIDVRQFINGAIYPIERINTAIDEMANCFASLSKLERSEFLFSGAVSITNINSSKKSSNWEWVSTPLLEGVTSIENLLTKESSFSLIASGKLTYYYANDKREAEKKHEYFPDDRDRTYHGCGSIICKEISEEIGKWKIRLILSISTYGKMIVSEDDIEAGTNVAETYEDVIRDMILKQFEGELREDLLWYGIEKIDFKKGKINPLAC